MVTIPTLPLVFAWSLLQPHFVIVALLAWAFERHANGKSTTAGVLLGLAAAVKVTPILFVLIFLADRDWRASAWALATSGGIAALSVLLMGWEAHAAFLEAAAFVNSITIFYGGNLTIEVVLQGLLYPGSIESTPSGMQFAEKTPWIAALSKALALIAAAGILWLTRHGDRAERTMLRAFFLVPALYYFSPLAWGHYYLLLLPMIMGLWGRLPPRLWAIALASSFVMLFLPLVLMIQYQFPEFPMLQYLQSGLLIVSLTTVAVGLRKTGSAPRENGAPEAVPA